MITKYDRGRLALSKSTVPQSFLILPLRCPPRYSSPLVSLAAMIAEMIPCKAKARQTVKHTHTRVRISIANMVRTASHDGAGRAKGRTCLRPLLPSPSSCAWTWAWAWPRPLPPVTPTAVHAAALIDRLFTPECGEGGESSFLS